MTAPAAALTRLLHLASTMLPVGAFSYSQGLEWAIESGQAGKAADASRWITDALRHAVARFEAPLLVAALRAWKGGDDALASECNVRFLATRESAELLAETKQTGYSLRRWCRDAGALDAAWCARLDALAVPSYPVVYAAVAAAWDLPERDAVAVYLWSWLENQVGAALKGVPLGQTDGQRILLAAGPLVDELAATCVERANEPGLAWPTQCPGLAIASSCHETQYSRLFRS